MLTLTLDNSLVHLLTHLISGQVTQVQCVIDWHCFDQCGMEELAKLCHQAVPLVFLGIVTEEAVQWRVKRVSDLHLWSKSIDDAATSTGLRVEDGSGQWADWAPGLGQRVIILHLKHSAGERAHQNVYISVPMLVMKGCHRWQCGLD